MCRVANAAESAGQVERHDQDGLAEDSLFEHLADACLTTWGFT